VVGTLRGGGREQEKKSNTMLPLSSRGTFFVASLMTFDI